MRRTGLTVVLTDLGVGEVNLVLPADRLLPVDPVTQGPKTASAPNCRLIDGVVKPRLGYKSIKTTPATSAVTGLFQAIFDNTAVEYLRSDAAGTYWDSGGTWTSIVAAGVGDRWTYAMVRRAGGTTIANQVAFCAGGDADNVWRYRGGGAAAASIAAGTILGARAIVGHRGRGLYMNVYDVANSARKTNRVYYSIAGDPETLTGTGSGFTDLDDDPYPIAASAVIGGNICVFKGNNVGGSVVVGSLSGVVTNPYRWDTINTNNVGILVPRSLISITPELAFFMGHDGFYLYDGARGLARVGDGLTRDILRRINYNALRYGFAWYKPAVGEIHLALPMGGSTYPTETWVFNVNERRTYGPYLYTHTMTSAAPYTVSDFISWDQLPGTWDALPYSSWDTIGGTASARGVIMGSSEGATWLDDEATLTDNTATLTATYTAAPVRPEGRATVMPNGQQRALAADEYLTLRDVTLIFTNVGEWTPVVHVSVDGGNTWTKIDEEQAVGGGTNINRLLTRPYTCEISGTWFQVRVTGDSNMRLLGIKHEFSYGGNARND